MRPNYSILDPSFRYVPAFATSVAETWRRFGWRPTTDEERKSRRGQAATLVVDQVTAPRSRPRAPWHPASSSATLREALAENVKLGDRLGALTIAL